MISARANISALSSIGLPSFKLSFFLSAFRRFFDDLLHIDKHSISNKAEVFSSWATLKNKLLRWKRLAYEEMRELLWEYLELVITLLASE